MTKHPSFVIRNYPPVALEPAIENANPTFAQPAPALPLAAQTTRRSVPAWEPIAIFITTFLVLGLFTSRITTYLDPTTGDEPFYLMTAISLIKDGDLNECNNYLQHDESLLYPSFYGISESGYGYVSFPSGWEGWTASPYPLPPHPALIFPASRQCASDYRRYPIDYDNPNGELYSKHGLGLSLLILPAFALGGRLLVVFFLNALGALLAANMFLFAREAVGRLLPALLTWLAFAFTVPQMPYSYLIFPELPAALLAIYAFRRVRLWHNNPFQVAAAGFCVAFLPWLHYRFTPLCVSLAIYYIFQWRKHRTDKPRSQVVRDLAIVFPQIVISASLLMLFFYTRYGTPWPNGSDHAGISDVPGTLRGIFGLFLDEQWGLFVAAPVFILTIVGVILMWSTQRWRRDLVWIGVVFIPYFLVIANYAQWWGEWCPPARYLTSILPLLALPFAVTFDSIKSMAHKAIYAILLLLSFLTMWGFLYQPQWMYNQPVVNGHINTKAELLVHGFRMLASALYFPPLRGVDLTGFFPSFVAPYFAYYQSKQFGDATANAAWRTSFWPLLIITLVILLSLLIAWWSQWHSRSSADVSSEQESTEEDTSPHESGVTSVQL